MVRDIGSIFYNLLESDQEMDRFKSANSAFLENNFHFYYSGRHAIHSILKHIEKNKSIGKIWLPSYFCHNVINAVRSRYTNVDFYESHPFELDIDLEFSSFINKDDVLFLNNYWGLRTFSNHFDKKSTPTIIEDHSHAWLSTASVNSKADYCIASIRKSYPIPLGAVVWRPQKESFDPGYESDVNDSIYDAFEKLSRAQELKRSFVKEEKLELQEKFLALLDQGEREVNTSKSIIKPDDHLMKLIRYFLPLDPNPIKRQNLDYSLNHLVTSMHFKILEKSSFTPFGLILIFRDEDYLNNFKSEMIKQNIYPAQLWPNNNHHHGFLLNIHLDFRYNEIDMEYLAEKINAWTIING